MKYGKKAILGMMSILFLSVSGYAEDLPASKGLYFSVPAYLYGQNSTFGLQAGYQFNTMHLRLDMNFAENYWDEEDVWIFMPSIGFFFSKDYQSVVRFYEGLTIGMEKGMVNSFDGIIGFANYIAGAEFLSFGNRTFFIEVGSGVSFSKEEGAYCGGTIVGGGFKYYY